ncbi:hypothetical protein RFZ44_20760, partial [Acinetobacter sp. 163]|nr:hypothetical protein [Acinetobacter sp. 163]
MIDDQIYVTLSIPNKEVCQIYKTKVLGWFKEAVGQKDLSPLYRAILEGNVSDFQEKLTGLLQDTI